MLFRAFQFRAIELLRSDTTTRFGTGIPPLGFSKTFRRRPELLIFVSHRLRLLQLTIKRSPRVNRGRNRPADGIDLFERVSTTVKVFAELLRSFILS